MVRTEKHNGMSKGELEYLREGGLEYLNLNSGSYLSNLRCLSEGYRAG